MTIAGWIGALLALFVLALAALGLSASYSPSGWLMLASVALSSAGLITARRRRERTPRRPGVTRAGLALFAAVVVGRMILVGNANARMVTLPLPEGSHWLGTVLDEQDVALLGARVVLQTWRLPASDRGRLLPAMHDTYVAMRAADGLTPSPVVDTLVGRQGRSAFDALVFEPHDGPPRAAVVFLHGSGGSFTLECWMMAEAARAIDAVTVCPATAMDGRWSAHDGDKILRATLDYVASRHLSRVFLAGLSNGGIGASLLVGRFSGSLSGLILISGASPAGSTGGLPTLVVQGEQDGNVSAEVTRAFASRTGATYAGFEGGHFVMMVRRTEVRDTIAAWLQRQRGAK